MSSSRSVRFLEIGDFLERSLQLTGQFIAIVAPSHSFMTRSRRSSNLTRCIAVAEFRGAHRSEETTISPATTSGSPRSWSLWWAG